MSVRPTSELSTILEIGELITQIEEHRAAIIVYNRRNRRVPIRFIQSAKNTVLEFIQFVDKLISNADCSTNTALRAVSYTHSLPSLATMRQNIVNIIAILPECEDAIGRQVSAEIQNGLLRAYALLSTLEGLDRHNTVKGQQNDTQKEVSHAHSNVNMVVYWAKKVIIFSVVYIFSLSVVAIILSLIGAEESWIGVIIILLLPVVIAIIAIDEY